MNLIPEQRVHQTVKDMVMRVGTRLPQDVLNALEQGRRQESDPRAAELLRQLLENAEVAGKTGLPLCQDTGTAVFLVEHGEDCRVEGGIKQVLNRAMAEAYSEAYFRKSVCYPLSRKNTGDNTPALIHTDLVEGDSIRIGYMAKGGGSENMSRCTNITPAEGWEGIKDFVLDRVATAGSNPCPPIIIGLGIGGSFDKAPLLAKKALFRPLDEESGDPEIAEMEKELLQEINSLGIGPMGLGGVTTCLGVRMEVAPCHIASLPVAVNFQCHSSRHEEVIVS